MGILSTLINGNAYDFSSIKLTSTVPGAPPLLERFTALNYTHQMSVGELRGRGSKVLGTTRGEYSANADMTVYLTDWELLKIGLMSLSPAGGGGFMMARFMLNVAFAEIGELPIINTLRGCRVISVGKSFSRGNEPLMVNVGMHVMEILEGGVPAVIDGSGVLSL